MYVASRHVLAALDALYDIHPFFQVTFLVCKHHGLPVGSTTAFAINREEKNFLKKYFSPAPQSNWFFKTWYIGPKDQKWVRSKYPSSSLQRMRSDIFPEAFIHDKNTDIWGWATGYLEALKKELARNRESKKIPAFALARWLYRERKLPQQTNPENLLQIFLDEFRISDEERDVLFDVSIPPNVAEDTFLNPIPISWDDLKPVAGRPPDAKPESGATLRYLELRAVGPSKNLKFEPGERLNLITGDNGLGKSFILDTAWWALSGHWAGLPAYPRPDAKRDEPRITFQIADQNSVFDKISASYDWQLQTWSPTKQRPAIPGLLIYARVDGSFAVWDPAKNWFSRPETGRSTNPRPLFFSKDEIWKGVESKETGRVFSNGLIRDWITWQSNPIRYPFDTFTKVLERLSPRDLGVLRPGEPVRLPNDARDIPTLIHPYGEVPVVHASAGIRRIIAMAYLLVWTWTEHVKQSMVIRREPENRLVILIDEMEAHLHPRWQRAILPALMDVHNALSSELKVQFLIATHSPLVLASAEPLFKPEQDKLFHLKLTHHDLFGVEVELQEEPFIRRGEVDAWLTSEVFELGLARSIEAEEAIKDAKKLQLQDNPDPEAIRRVSDRLARLLPEHDRFWPRWLYFAEQHGDLR